MKHQERITGQDNLMSAISKLAEGNPGAAMALVKVAGNNSRIDPDSALGPISSIISLDSIGIYGTDIYVLYSDICEREDAHFVAVLRACQLGLFDRNILKDACSRQDYSGKEMIPVTELYNKVKEQLPNFDL